MLTSPKFLACTGSQTEDLKSVASKSTTDNAVRVLARIRAGRHRNVGSVPNREKRFVTFLQHLDQRLRRTFLSSKKSGLLNLLFIFIHRLYHECVSVFWIFYVPTGGTAWGSWSRYCATSRKVAGSIPDGVIGIFHWHNPPVALWP
jgi:hypothetical protein